MRRLLLLLAHGQVEDQAPSGQAPGDRLRGQRQLQGAQRAGHVADHRRVAVVHQLAGATEQGDWGQVRGRRRAGARVQRHSEGACGGVTGVVRSGVRQHNTAAKRGSPTDTAPGAPVVEGDVVRRVRSVGAEVRWSREGRKRNHHRSVRPTAPCALVDRAARGVTHWTVTVVWPSSRGSRPPVRTHRVTVRRPLAAAARPGSSATASHRAAPSARSRALWVRTACVPHSTWTWADADGRGWGSPTADRTCTSRSSSSTSRGGAPAGASANEEEPAAHMVLAGRL